MSEKIYAERDIIGMDSKGGHYCRHISAMTREGLHSKSDIAAELGFRDMVISELEAKCAALAAEKEKFAVECAAAKIAIAYLKSGRQDFSLNTTATDAFLAEVRAQGVEMFMESDECSQEAYGLALRFAAQLRQDANTAELVAAGIITKVGE